jgi:hypothetical protein
MSRLEDELRAALGREEPPAGFADRVLARARPAGFRRLRWVAALAACLALAAGGLVERERRERARGEMAKRQVMLALGITGSKLQFVKEKIHAMHSERR